jgi:hypothetical protein
VQQPQLLSQLQPDLLTKDNFFPVHSDYLSTVFILILSRNLDGTIRTLMSQETKSLSSVDVALSGEH